MRAVLLRLLALLVLLCAGPVLAASYSLPGALPPGCSAGGGGSYTCGSLSLGYGDTLTVASPKPATLTINGDFSTNNAVINSGGSAADLQINVSGRLLLQYQTQIKAHISAGSVDDESGAASLSGNLSVSGSGTLRLRWTTSVSGNLSSASGSITLDESNVIGGNIASTGGGAISIGYRSTVAGSVSTSGAVTLGQEADVTGAVDGGSGAISVGYAARLRSSLSSTSGNIGIAQASRVDACVRSTLSASITLGYQSTVNSVCCGSGSCGTACVTNDSTYAMPATCAATVTQTYSNTSLPFDWVDASGHTKIGANTSPYKFSGGGGCVTTPPTIDDTLSNSIPLGFSFAFGTTTYTSVRVMTNGRLQFGSNTTCGAGTASIGPPQTYPYSLPNSSMNTTMKVFGVDLDPTNLAEKPDYPTASSKTSCLSLATCYVSVATLGSAPNRRFVVTWYHVPEWVNRSNTSGSFDVQVILNENGTFVYQYGTISHGGTGTAQVGWQLSSSDYDVLEFGAATEPPPNSAILFYIPSPVLAQHQHEEGAWYPGAAGQVRDSSGNARHAMAVGAAQATANGKICRGANIPLNTSAATVSAIKLTAGFGTSTGVPLAGAGSVMMWIKSNTAWAGVRDAQLLDAGTVDGQWFYLSRRASGALRFVITDSTGTTRAIETAAQNFAANTWQHVAVVWNYNGSPVANSDSMALYVNGSKLVSSSFTSDGSLATSLGAIHVGDNPSGFAGPGGTVNSADAVIDEIQVLNYIPSDAQVIALMNATHDCDSFDIDHLELRHGSWNGVACSAGTLTVLACADASFPCTNPYTKGTLVTLSAASASGGAAAWWVSDNDNTVPIGWGTSSSSKQVYISTGSMNLGASALPATNQATRCNGSGNSCTWTSVNGGLLVSAPTVTGGKPTAVAVQAVESVGTSPPQRCSAMQGISGASLKLWAAPVVPAAWAATRSSAGVTVGGAPAVSASSGGSYTTLGASQPASDTVSGLAFDSESTTRVWLRHMDAGQFTLNAQLSRSNPSFTLNGSGAVSVVPAGLGITAPSGWAAPASVQTACASGASAACDSAAGAAPVVAKAGDAFSTAVLAALWTHDGDADLGDNPAAPSVSGTADLVPQLAAPMGGTVGTLGTTSATLSQGSSPVIHTQWTQSGALRLQASMSWMGSNLSGQSQVLGRVRPSQLRVTVNTPGCGSFTYSGQPISRVTVEALDGASPPGVASNYRGDFARLVTLSDTAGVAGSFSAHTLAAASFGQAGSLGQATAAPVFTFTSPTTAPALLTLRASDGETSSAGQAGGEPTAAIRSGRLRLSNATGSVASALQLPVTAEHWGGTAWVVNSADHCSTLPAAAVALSNWRDAAGAVTATRTSASSVALSAGRGLLTLAAPTPAGLSLSVDVALNLGSSAADQSCLASHPSTTGAQLPWLRSRNGACASTWDRDPAARASFGVFAPETRRTSHVRELF